MKWTRFFDLSSGGYEKLPYCTIYIELPIDEAIPMFKTIFGINPENITCQCCGSDYSINEYDGIEDVVRRDIDVGHINHLIVSLESMKRHFLIENQ